jgi:hypothetical protein
MASRVPIDWKGWLWWVAAMIVGANLVVIIVYFSFPFVETFTAKDSPAQIALELLSLGIAGTTFATMQWIWLRRRMRKPGWWIAATVVSWYVAIGLDFLVSSLPLNRFGAKFEMAARISVLFLIAITANLPQWFLVRRMFFGASYWLAARPLGWLAGLGIVFLGHGLGVIEIPFPFASAEVFGRNVPDLVAWSFGAVLFGIGFGAITGAAILWIRRKPKDALTGESS